MKSLIYDAQSNEMNCIFLLNIILFGIGYYDHWHHMNVFYWLDGQCTRLGVQNAWTCHWKWLSTITGRYKEFVMNNKSIKNFLSAMLKVCKHTLLSFFLLFTFKTFKINVFYTLLYLSFIILCVPRTLFNNTYFHCSTTI